MEKIAVLAPMPSASDRMATSANAGLRSRIRMLYLMSCTICSTQRVPARVAAGLGDLHVTTEGQSRATARLAFRHSAAHELGDLALDVVAELAVELGVEAVAAEQATPPGHGTSPSGAAMIRPTASDSRRQLASSLSIACRPLRVSR